MTLMIHHNSLHWSVKESVVRETSLLYGEQVSDWIRDCKDKKEFSVYIYKGFSIYLYNFTFLKETIYKCGHPHYVLHQPFSSPILSIKVFRILSFGKPETKPVGTKNINDLTRPPRQPLGDTTSVRPHVPPSMVGYTFIKS